MDAETTLLIAASRRRRELGEALGELDAALEAQPQSRTRVVSAPGWRDVGMARFKAVRRVVAREGHTSNPLLKRSPEQIASCHNSTPSDTPGNQRRKPTHAPQ